MWLREIRHEWWGELTSGDGFRVMTYHHFGEKVSWNGPELFKDVDLIICDEMHSLITYIGIELGIPCPSRRARGLSSRGDKN